VSLHEAVTDDLVFEPSFQSGLREDIQLESMESVASPVFGGPVSGPIRMDVPCCGIGHRFLTMAAIARDLSPHTIAWNWGPCQGKNNVFGEIFKPNSVFVTYEPHEGAAPFPYMQNLTSRGVNQKEIPRHIQGAFVELLLNKLSDQYMNTINVFKRQVGWDRAPVIGLHIRTGNVPENTTELDYKKESRHIHRRIGGKLQEELGLEDALRLYMIHAAALAENMGISENYQVLVVTDNGDVLKSLDNMTGLPRWFSRPQTYQEGAHPLIFSNLLLNNAGERCQIDWFSEGILDLHLLASSSAMLTSMSSSFYRVAEMAHLMNDRPVCHCAQNRKMPATCTCIGDDDPLIAPDFFAQLMEALS
jgi:hypothetical protein